MRTGAPAPVLPNCNNLSQAMSGTNVPPKSWNRVPRLQLDALSQLWKGRAIENGEGVAVKPSFQECGKSSISNGTGWE
jgi:hypothetical protein